MQSRSAITSSCPTSASGIIVLLKYQTLDFVYVEVLNVNMYKIVTVCTISDCFKNRVLWSVSIFGQTTGYTIGIYTVSGESIRLPEIQ